MKFKVLFSFLVALLSLNLYSQTDKQMNTALILIDIQQFYFVEGSSQLVNPEAASEQARILLNKFREKGDLVVHVQHASKQNMDIHPNVLPLEGEKVITKHYVNSYRETNLLEFLNKNKIEKVIIGGMMTHVCVEAASRASADYGFKVVVITDACATRDVVFGNSKVKAADVHSSTLGTIDAYYGNVMTVEDFLIKEY